MQTQWQTGQAGPGQTLRSADQTMDVELADRVTRVQRLARLDGVTPPRIEQLSVQPGLVGGASRPVPVIRVTFDEHDFFASGSAAMQSGAEEVMRIMAENMRHDVPDVRVTVLGHTDASGSERTNLALSQERALGMVQALVASGVNPGQLSVVAIGEAQPIAPNSSQAGRARNRRVEFLISPSEQANLALVSSRPVDPAYLSAAGPAPRSARRQVAILKPRYTGPSDFSETPPVPGSTSRGGRVSLAEAGPRLIVGADATGSPVGDDGADVGVAETGSPADPAIARYTAPQR